MTDVKRQGPGKSPALVVVRVLPRWSYSAVPVFSGWSISMTSAIGAESPGR